MARTKPLPKAPPISFAHLRAKLRGSWEQGQHFSIIAPTGGGKTTIATRGLLPLWRYVLVLDAKGDDDSLKGFGHPVRNHPLFNRTRERYVLHPAGSMADMRATFADSFGKLWKDGQWVVYVDETRLFADWQYLNLSKELDRLWLFGRSRGVTVIAGTQAPRYVPSAFYEQPRHFLIGFVKDQRAIKRLGEISGDVDAIRALVPELRPFEFLYVGPDNALYRTRLELRG